MLSRVLPSQHERLVLHGTLAFLFQCSWSFGLLTVLMRSSAVQVLSGS